MRRARTGWAVAVVGVALALVAGVGYFTSDQAARYETGVGAALPLGPIDPVVPVPDKPRPAPMPDVNPLGPR